MKMDYITRKKLAEKLAETSQANLGALGWGGALAQGLAGFGSGYMGAKNDAYDKEQKTQLQAQLLSGDTQAVLGSLIASENPDMQKTGMAALLANTKPKEDYTVGNTRLSGTTNKPIFTAPEKPNLPPGHIVGADGRVSLMPGLDPSFGRKSDGTKVNINTKFESEYDKALGKNLAEQRIKYGTDADTARNTLNNLNSIETAMSGIQTGKLMPTKANISAFIEGVGGDPKRYNLPDVTSAQTFNAATSSIVLDLAQGMKGAFSDKDIAFLKEMAPQLGSNPEANKRIMAMLREGAKRQIGKYDKALTYEQQHGNIGGFERAYQDDVNKNPVNYGYTPPSAEPNSGSSKVINGVTYIQKNGEWFAQ